MDKEFIIKSPTASIVGHGKFISIDEPATDAADLNGRFQTSLASAFAKAKKHGIENPIVVGSIPFDPSQKSALYIPESWQKLSSEDVHELEKYENTCHLKIKSSEGVSHDTYTKMVADAVAKIKSGDLDKVVLGRTETIKPEEPIDSKALVARLLAQNPQGYNFHLPLPDGSILAGSSPELLVRKEADSFKSQPLAGSAARGRNEQEERDIQNSLLSSKKDLHEHKLVVDWMRSVLQPISTELSAPSTPHTISTPKLWHLATTINGKIKDKSANSLSLAGHLHPTPALSGFPQVPAQKLLKELEPFDRKYFGGIVGYSDSEGNGEWFIAIRCLNLSSEHVTLFAGAGIVGDSDPESEWRETAVKLSTMQHIFD